MEQQAVTTTERPARASTRDLAKTLVRLVKPYASRRIDEAKVADLRAVIDAAKVEGMAETLHGMLDMAVDTQPRLRGADEPEPHDGRFAASK